jgi:hypothetical protein
MSLEFIIAQALTNFKEAVETKYNVKIDTISYNICKAIKCDGTECTKSCAGDYCNIHLNYVEDKVKDILFRKKGDVYCNSNGYVFDILSSTVSGKLDSDGIVKELSEGEKKFWNVQ